MHLNYAFWYCTSTCSATALHSSAFIFRLVQDRRSFFFVWSLGSTLVGRLCVSIHEEPSHNEFFLTVTTHGIWFDYWIDRVLGFSYCMAWHGMAWHGEISAHTVGRSFDQIPVQWVLLCSYKVGVGVEVQLDAGSSTWRNPLRFSGLSWTMAIVNLGRE